MAQAPPHPPKANCRLWGERPPRLAPPDWTSDWADVHEGQFAAGDDDVLARVTAGPGTRLLDAGCGAGMAALRAAGLGAR